MRLVLPLVLLASPAAADLTFCNESGMGVTVAIGYSDGGLWTSEGWWTVDDGACRSLVKGDLPKRYYYWRATAKAGAFAGGAYSFCTDGEPFTIAGDGDCEGRGFDTSLFRETDIGEAVAHTITLRAADAPRDVNRKATVRDTRQDIARKAPPPAPVRADAGPGTFGEPLSLTATFRGCWAVAEERECSFEAGGWTYVALETGPTAPEVIDQLDGFADGTEIGLSGDLIFHEGNRAEIMVRHAAEVPPVPTMPSEDSARWDGLMEFLQGDWEADDGSGSGWMIEGNRLRVIHDANIAEEYDFEIHDDCAASNGLGPVIVGWPNYAPSMGPACFLVTGTGPRHLVVRDVVEGWSRNFSYLGAQ